MSLTDEITFDKDGRVEKNPLFQKLLLAIIILLVSTLAFGLGRLSVGKREGIKLEVERQLTTDNLQPASVSNAVKSLENSKLETENSTSVVGSSKGTKYHYPYCPGAKQISEKNKVVFASADAAEASGYTLAGNCVPK